MPAKNFVQGFVAIGFKIPQSMIKVEKQVFVFFKIAHKQNCNNNCKWLVTLQKNLK